MPPVTKQPADDILKLMQQRIDSYLVTREDPSLYQSIRNMSQFVSDDYGNRFLIELIQNAHDAHSPERQDGEISIVFAPDEGEFGCLYVANRGTGFTLKNVRAITNIALSSKPVNAGIGNKGLGFRSVLQICDWPEIHSVAGSPGAGCFDGYCFRFAQENDLREVGSAKDAASEMAANIPCWHIPVPLLGTSPRVSRFAKEGFATVVKLPLKSADAVGLVSAELDRLLSLQTPLHLFLSRIACISIEREPSQQVRLQRTILETWTLSLQDWKPPAPLELSKVRIGDIEYLVADWDVDDTAFRPQLEASLAKKEVPASWSDWEGRARVSLAVPLGPTLEKGTLYCFLPLGEEGRAPSSPHRSGRSAYRYPPSP